MKFTKDQKTSIVIPCDATPTEKFAAEELKKYLEIPDHCIPFSVICVGYPESEGKVHLRYDKSKVHFDRY